MATREAPHGVRYLTDSEGERTDVLIPLDTWQRLLSAWKEMAERLEDQEDLALAQAWLAAESEGRAKTISLDELKRELLADGLLPG